MTEKNKDICPDINKVLTHYVYNCYNNLYPFKSKSLISQLIFFVLQLLFLLAFFIIIIGWILPPKYLKYYNIVSTILIYFLYTYNNQFIVTYILRKIFLNITKKDTLKYIRGFILLLYCVLVIYSIFSIYNPKYSGFMILKNILTYITSNMNKVKIDNNNI